VKLRAVGQGLARALGGARRRPLPSLLAIGAIGVSLVLLGLVLLALQNLGRMAAPWGEGVQMVVYLDAEVSPERAREIAAVLRRVDAVEQVDYVAPDLALTRLRESLGERGALLDGVETGYLPASLELRLAPGVREVAEASPLVARLRATPGVEEVEFLGDWVAKLAALHRTLRLIALGLALAVALACVYVVAGTISLGMVARRDEIEVLELVGATDRFVRLPLVLEGALQGVLGAGLALLLLAITFRVSAPVLEGTLAGAVGAMELSFLPAGQIGLGLLLGGVLGLVGSVLALGRAGRPRHA
jgi:cell division transport system permease protein